MDSALHGNRSFYAKNIPENERVIYYEDYKSLSRVSLRTPPPNGRYSVHKN